MKVEVVLLPLGTSRLLKEKVLLDDDTCDPQVRRSKATVPRIGVMCEDM